MCNCDKLEHIHMYVLYSGTFSEGMCDTISKLTCLKVYDNINVAKHNWVEYVNPFDHCMSRENYNNMNNDEKHEEFDKYFDNDIEDLDLDDYPRCRIAYFICAVPFFVNHNNVKSSIV